MFEGLHVVGKRKRTGREMAPQLHSTVKIKAVTPEPSACDLVMKEEKRFKSKVNNYLEVLHKIVIIIAGKIFTLFANNPVLISYTA